MTKKDPEEKRRKRERKQARSAALGFDGGEMAGTPEIANPNTAVLRRSRSALLLGAVAGAILIGLASYALLTRNIQATRDAYVAGNVVPVTAQEAGTVIAIGADDTQAVKAGDTLVTLDSTLANVRMSAAEAELASALRQVGNAPRQGHGRAGKLGRAKHRRAKATAANAARDPAVLAAIADIRQSAIIQAHLRIVAPVDGVVALRTVQIDEQLSAGTPLMAVVPLRSVWVVANFRQAQLANLRIGQPVRVKSDIWGSAVTFHGRVAGLSAGSGLGSLSQRSGGGWFKP